MSKLDILIRNIVYLRKKSGLNQAEFAVSIGLNYKVIASYEQKIANPSIETVMKISEKFDIDIYKLLYIDIQAYEVNLNDESEVFKVKEDNQYIDVNYEFVRLTKSLVDLYEENKKLKEKLYYISINNLNKI